MYSAVIDKFTINDVPLSSSPLTDNKEEVNKFDAAFVIKRSFVEIFKAEICNTEVGVCRIKILDFSGRNIPLN